MNIHYNILHTHHYFLLLSQVWMNTYSTVSRSFKRYQKRYVRLTRIQSSDHHTTTHNNVKPTNHYHPQKPSEKKNKKWWIVWFVVEFFLSRRTFSSSMNTYFTVSRFQKIPKDTVSQSNSIRSPLTTTHNNIKPTNHYHLHK